MNRIDAFFTQGKKAFVPYITAGFPNVEATLENLKILVENGADIIELGLPFSDPTADGPVIQTSSFKALEAGFKIDMYFDLIKQFRELYPEVPVVCFTYFNPVFHIGVDSFVKRLAEAGGDAMLVVDLPFEEQSELELPLEKEGLHLIPLIAPTTGNDRKEKVLKEAGGFVYQIALKGVTGMRETVAEGVSEMVQETQTYTKLPVCLGFGVSSGDQAAAIADTADGVVVGSALVNCIDVNLPNYQDKFTSLVKELAEAIHA
ncbi:MAG: tryptophan synthase subunit alpha [Lentisphaeria bacterium]|nr:tryptophan synthase subunit alpha [Lentisphaeria bacterium]